MELRTVFIIFSYHVLYQVQEYAKIEKEIAYMTKTMFKFDKVWKPFID